MKIKNDLNLKQFYQDLVIYEVAKVVDTGEKYLVKYITESTISWDEMQDDSFIPLHPLSAETIREAHRFGKEVYINKNWDDFSKEVLVASLEVNNITDLDGYKRRASGFPRPVRLRTVTDRHGASGIWRSADTVRRIPPSIKIPSGWRRGWVG